MNNPMHNGFSPRPAAEMANGWKLDKRWEGITRPYSETDVARLRGTLHVEHTLARAGAERLWNLLHTRPDVNALGAMTGNQAVAQVAAGLEEIGRAHV